jgi:type IV secretory pathway TrbD component
MTPRPVCTVLARPITMAFVERRLFGLTLTTALVVFVATGWFSAAAATFLVGYGLAFWTRDDPTLVVTIVRALRTRTHYDPAVYRRPEIEIQ